MKIELYNLSILYNTLKIERLFQAKIASLERYLMDSLKKN